ncbi:CNH domain-domain-containing protein [Naematelia encephala]|uniref:CNH domain-domain-containing protein n=1 Tax=Naematelia encephala TaxID=71784 RepID=A0A1Y2AXN9_9TREE|nr:CNH domain-domain-containing protein [Naematelia encephala]
MPPSGPRSRPSQPPNAAPPSANSRNQAFESIFGRPAGGHHLGNAPGAPTPPPAGGYGYGGHPAPPAGGSTYLSPAQPSYPPGHAYAPPPPRAQSHAYAQPHVGDQSSTQPSHAASNGSYGRATPQPYMTGGYMTPPDPLPDRRASLAPSLAPSTYSNSSAGYYTAPPHTTSPPLPRQGRLPTASIGHHSSQSPAQRQVQSENGHGAYPVRLPAAANLSAAQQYQASQGYGALASPASVVFPHRAAASPAPVPNPSASATSLATTSSTSSRGPAVPSKSSSSRSPPPRMDEPDRLISPPPDYTRAMGNMSLNVSSSKGFLDSVQGIPNRAESSEPGPIDNWTASHHQTGHTHYHHQHQNQQHHHDHRHDTRQSSSASTSTHSMHRRMVSDSSIASSSHTMTSNNHRNHVTPLSQIDASPSTEAVHDSPTTPTGSESGGFAFHAQRRLSGRKSVDSTLSLPTLASIDSALPPGAAPSATGFDTRATSFSGSSTTRTEAVAAVRSGSLGPTTTRRNPPTSFTFPTPQTSQHSLSGKLDRSASSARIVALQAVPNIYPALLSKVAEAFKQLISLSEVVKDGITYKDAFDGRTAVAVIAEIIKTPDRNLALLLGRALDAQKFFHDVTYDHRLRDNPIEIYQFKERLTAPFMNENAVTDSPMSEHAALGRTTSTSSRNLTRPPPLVYTSDSGSIQTSDSQFSFNTNSPNHTPATSSSNLAYPMGSPQLLTKISSGGSVPTGLSVPEETSDSEDDLPVGVFTLLTDCYSPTCSREALCYSINCPRRLEQMKRLNMKPQPGLSRKLSSESIKDVKETGTLWIHSVSQEILDSVDDQEKKRQEAINEVIYTERDFVRDLEYLRDSWVKPLMTKDVVEASKREDFVRQVFWNVHEVLAVNQVLAERLTKRQKQQPVVQSIGDLFKERVPLFEPFVTYGAHQLFGKYEFEKEKGANPAFQRFVDETERKPESRKLELNGYLTKPTTRLGRYPLLLAAVLKYTPDDHPDKRDLQEAITMVKGFLTKVNIESGKSENIFELAQLEQQLVFRPQETIDLRLRDKNRELVHKGPLKRRGGNRDEIADLIGFLFDHAFLLVKPKWVNKAEQYRVYRRPIPLELLVIVTPDDHYNSTKLSSGRGKLMARPTASGKTGSGTHVPPKPESKHGFSISIAHLGKKGYSMQLWVDTWVSRKKWLECIDKQQGLLRERSCVFVTESITDGYFGGLRKINCISPYDQGHRMIYGTDEGVYFSNLRDDKLREPVKVINLLDVTQVDVIEEFQLLIVLHERSVTTFPLDCLDPNDPNAALKRGKRISSHTSFFKSGVCLGKMLVAVVKSSTLSSTIKVLEPVDLNMRGKKPQGSFMRRLNGRDDALKLFKEFYIPTESSSVHFLKTKLCVGCIKGFEIVDLETLDMQGLLDPSDSSLDFVLKRDNVRPIAIYRIEEDFLLCYDEFAFYINKNGWRARPKWAIIWEGVPTAFALQYPYVVAFEPTFIEVHHVETGHLVQIIPGSNIQCLFADTPPSRVNAPIPPPSRGLIYPPQYPPRGAPTPQSFSAYAAQPYAGRPPIPTPGFMPPPPPPPPAPVVPRYARPQVIFTSEDGHVQFLKFPPPGRQAGTISHTTRPSR